MRTIIIILIILAVLVLLSHCTVINNPFMPPSIEWRNSDAADFQRQYDKAIH